MAQLRQCNGIPPNISRILVVGTPTQRTSPLIKRGNVTIAMKKIALNIDVLDGDTMDENKLEEEGGDPLEHEEDNPEISIHALARINLPQTMRVQGYIKKYTHNFIDPNITKQVELYIYPCENLKVMIANGGKLAYKGKTRNVLLTMANCHCKLDICTIHP
ncbi:hypothetical protein AMTRI_Chr03g143980 [Amborella trichopoda]